MGSNGMMEPKTCQHKGCVKRAVVYTKRNKWLCGEHAKEDSKYHAR